MCIILHTKAGSAPIDKAEFEKLRSGYGSSYGIMWPDKKAGKVRREVATEHSTANANRVYDKYVEKVKEGLEVTIQFRSGSGPNVQPCLNDDETLGVAVNGSIRYLASPAFGIKDPVPSVGSHSDTTYFAKYILPKLTEQQLLDPFLAGWITGGCNAVFMTPNGSRIIEAARNGTEEYEGTWYSQKQWRPKYDEFGGYYDQNNVYAHGPNFTGTKRAGVRADGYHPGTGRYETIEDPALIAKQFQRMMDELKKEREAFLKMCEERTAVGTTEKPKRSRKIKKVTDEAVAEELAASQV